MGVGEPALGHPRYTRERCRPSWLHRNGGQRCSHLLRRSASGPHAEIPLGKIRGINGFRGNPGLQGGRNGGAAASAEPVIVPKLGREKKEQKEQKAAQEEEARAKAKAKAEAKAKGKPPWQQHSLIPLSP